MKKLSKDEMKKVVGGFMGGVFTSCEGDCPPGQEAKITNCNGVCTGGNGYAKCEGPHNSLTKTCAPIATV